jgi:hypothetical protein
MPSERPAEGDQHEFEQRVLQRFEEERQKTKNEHVPAMDPSTFLDSLLDTREAVRRGYYDDAE